MADRDAVQPAQLTILTVVLNGHYPYVRQQIELIEALNPGAPFKMVVVDNSSHGEPELKIDDPRCVVIGGVEPDMTLPEHGRGSYHHAAALKLGLAHVDTPWLLVLDPDFFVVYRNWIAEVTEHMRARRLKLFGAPWHYAWSRKWRYFPCVHFLMIDVSQVGLDELDFTPDLHKDEEDASALHQWLRGHAPVLRNRLLLESRRDTGWPLHREVHRVAAPAERVGEGGVGADLTVAVEKDGDPHPQSCAPKAHCGQALASATASSRSRMAVFSL